MKRIYIIHESVSSKVNGIGTYIRELCRGLNSMGYEITLVDVNSDEKEFAIVQEKGRRRMCIPVFSPDPFMTASQCIVAFLRMHVDDAVGNVFLFNQFPCRLLVEAVKESFPLSRMVFVAHDMSWTTVCMGKVELLQKAIAEKNDQYMPHFEEECRLYKTVDKVVCLSEDAYRVLLSVYGQDSTHITLISNGLHDVSFNFSDAMCAELRRQYCVSHDDFLIVWAGRTAAVKGLDILQQAFEKVLEQMPNARLAVIGPLFDNIPILRRSRRYASRVTYTGFLPQQDVYDWYRMADIGVMPSYSEQCSYTGIELLMFGLPIVASDGNGVDCMFTDGKDALVVPIGSLDNPEKYVECLASAILAMNDKNTRRILSKGSRDSYLSKYTADKMYQQYDQLFQSLC